jgi:hypothetical protein
MPPSGTIYWLLPLVALPAFALSFIAVAYSISRMGWSDFAARHDTSMAAHGPSMIARSLRFDRFFASYNNAVRVSFLPGGLHFSVLFPFSAAHRPFLLPWSSVTRAEREPAWFGERYVVELDDAAGRIRIRFPVAAQALLEAGRKRAQAVAG